MDSKLLTGLTLSGILLLSQSVFAQNLLTESSSFQQSLHQLTPQQKMILLDKLAAQINARYAKRPSNDIIKSYNVSHNAPHNHALTYTYHLQPTLRQLPEWHNGQIYQYLQDFVAQNKVCMTQQVVANINQLNIYQVRIVFQMENKIVFEKTQDLPICH